MKKLTILILVEAVIGFHLSSQPGSVNMFRVHRNIVYAGKNNHALKLDLYLPGGQIMEAGVGVAEKPLQQGIFGNAQASARPVLLWLPGYGKDIFPTPVTDYVGNEYAMVSLQVENESTCWKNVGQALDYLHRHADRFHLDTEKTGLILPVSDGYLAFIWQDSMRKLKSPAGAPIQMTIVTASDPDFSILQLAENKNQLIRFFDTHLRNGLHSESDPLALRCPPDSWIDPVTNPIPGTTYHLFPTPVRGENQQGSYLIYLPRDYANSGERYPVIYWLHGGNGNSREGAWMCGQLDAAMQRGDMPPCMVVFVQGLPIGWYNNSKDGTMPIEDVIIKDLIPHIDATYRTINRREARGIDGMSMGGYGSLHLGFKYPELFGVVSSIAPSITTFEMERKEVLVQTFEDDADYFNVNHPSTLVQKNADYLRDHTVIRLLVGDRDFLYDLVQQFHRQLNDLQINHQYAIAKDADHDYKQVIANLGFNAFEFWGKAFP
jgi:enterochelin esterase-like enzyme